MGVGGFRVNDDNTDKVIEEMKLNIARALEIVGMNAEKYAKALCPVGTSESTGKKGYRGGTLRNSITHDVNKQEQSVTIGSNVEYAPYVELGTGPFFAGAPEWVQTEIPTPAGTGHSYVHPRPYLRPAIEEHFPEYESIIREELKG